MIAIVLGSGMNNLIDFVEVEKSISYQSISEFDIVPLEGHDRIIYEAKLNGKSLIILSGKLHLYEGYTYQQSIVPLEYVNTHYSIDQWIVTSASGALSESIIVGEWQKVSDIISLEKINGLSIRTNRITFPKIELATYAYQRGPSLGTVAEYKMLNQFGADLVGMSMAPERIYLNSINAQTTLYSLPVCTYHPVTYRIKEPSHKEVMQIADTAVSGLVTILSSLISTP